MNRHSGVIVAEALLCCAASVFAQTQPTEPVSDSEAPPNMVLLYYGYDKNGPRDWTAERIKYYVGYYRERGTDAEAPVDTFFDTVLWMYRTSSRGHLFEAGAKHQPTTKPDWEECLGRLFETGHQLCALEAATAELETRLGRRVNVNVIFTLPYPDVRVAAWSEVPGDPQWDFRDSDEPRLAAVRWYIDAALERWGEASFPHLRLLGFYWFNESHINLRDPQKIGDESQKNDVGLIRSVARHIHSLRVAGRPLTLTWIPYSPYGGERVGVVAELLKCEPAERVDYLMVQPNYFFARWKKERADLTAVVRAAAAAGAGVEIEFDESLVRDEAARQRLRDYLEVIPAEHPRWNAVPAGYYQGLRTVHELATRPELASLYDELYRLVVQRRTPTPRP
jgi:hypothetical protein